MKKLITIISTVLFLSCTTNETEVQTEDSYKHILVVGNSIVKHSPAPELGWTNDCGMAATPQETDFCGVIKTELKPLTFTRKNVAYWEADFNYNLNNFTDVNSYQYDLIIIKVGENVSFSPEYKQALKDMINHFKGGAKENVKIIIVSTIWWNDELNTVHSEVALEENYIYCDVNSIKEDYSNFAMNEYENEAVRIHPNNKGMKFIADKILEKINLN